MDIQKLYDRIQRQTDQGRFCLSGETSGLTVVQQICVVFGMDGIELCETVCELQEETLTLQGIFYLSPSGERFPLILTAESGGQIKTIVDLAGVYMDEDKWFCIRDGQLEIVLQEGTDVFLETMAGHSSLGKVTYSFQGNRKEITEKRTVILCREERTDSTEILDSGLALFGLSLSGFPVRPAPVEISFFSFSYTLPSGWLMGAAPEKKQVPDYFKWQIRTSLGFELTDLFGMKDIGFAMEKYGSVYELSMSGIFEIFRHDFPFFLTYNGRGFHITLSECAQAELETINDLGVLSGDKDLSRYLPQDFVPEGVISLYSLQLALPQSFSGVHYFQIAVNFHFEWEISHSPSLILHDIMLSYEYNPGSKFFSISGKINFLGAETLLYAGVIAGNGEKDAAWQFMWRMYDDESISITDFVGQLAEFLGTPRTQITLPQVELCQVQAVYAGGSFSFHAKIDVRESRLFAWETELIFVSRSVGGKRDYAAELSWKSTTHTLTVGNILEECGAGEALADLPAFLRDIGLEKVDIAYDFIENKISMEIVISKVGRLSVWFIFGEKKEYEIIFEPEINEISLTGIPVAGGLVEKMLPSAGDFSVSRFALCICSKENKQRAVPAGICMVMKVLGKEQVFVLYQPAHQSRGRVVRTGDTQIFRQDEETKKPKTAWINVNKTFSILSIYRIGVGMDDARLVLMLDAALNIQPLSFGVEGMGIGITMSCPSDIRFYLSGLSVAFRNDLLSVAGEFVKEDDTYAGELMIQVKQICVAAVGEYSRDGSLMALAAVNYNFGGPPAFFVTGFSFGFGYHKDLVLPEIADVPEHPLVRAARGQISRAGMKEALQRYIKSVPGEKFIAAGVRFTSFNIMDSSVIAVVKFGNLFELGVLGLAEISVPPSCPQTPVAYAGLALEAVVRPEAGYFGVEARLTSESYILSKDCKLRGGFALYGWFGGEHSGDMVITLGGYYPGYQKPQHYPSVPRVGFDWKIGDDLDISGELYFALTPREIMAGGRLNAVYTLGKLRAWFIAAADFIMGWKPFYYEASVKVQIGVSYRVDFLFVHHTFTVELGVGLDLWGPEFGGVAHISWFIISFDIRFGSKGRNKNTAISWDEFTESFLPQAEKKQGLVCLQSDQGKASVPVTISFTDGVIKADERTVCRGDGLEISVESAVPVTSYSVNGGVAENGKPDLFVQPMGGKALQSSFQVEIVDERGQRVEMGTAPVKKNLPSALWGKKNGGTLVQDAVCGLVLSSRQTEFNLFPVKHMISLDELYENGTIRIRDAFRYQGGMVYPSYTTEGSVKLFQETVESEKVRERRKQFLAEQGICGAVVSLGGYAANAGNLLSEDFMVI